MASFKVIENPTYKDDFHETFKYNQWLLFSISIWPSHKRPSTSAKVALRLITFIDTLLMMAFMVPILFKLALLKQDLRQMMDDNGVLTVFMGYFSYFLIFKTHNHIIRAFIEQTYLDWKHLFQGSRGVMIKHAKLSKIWLAVIISVWMTTWTSWLVLALTSEPYYVDDKIRHILPYPAYYIFFDASVVPYYYFIFILQAVGNLVFVLVICNISMIVTFALHICGQYEILSAIIADLGNNKGDYYHARSWLSRVVKKHYTLTRLTSYLEDTFTWIFFIVWFTGLSGLYTCSYYLVVDEQNISALMRNFTSINSLLSSFFAICYIGEKLTQECFKLSDAAYMSKWYNLSNRDANSVYIINSIHKFPKQLSAGKLNLLTMNTFTDVLRKTMAVYSCFRTLS